MKVAVIRSIVVLGACSAWLPGHAQDVTSIILTDDAAFTAVDGSSASVSAGVYEVSSPDGTTLSLAGEDGVISIRAEQGTHDESLTSSSVVLAAAEGQTHIVLLLPGGTSLEAATVAAGVQRRGIERVRVSRTDASRYMQQYRAGSIMITAPASRARWTPDRQYDITWRRSGTMSSSVRILLLKDRRVHATLMRSAPNNGRFTWKIPANLGGQFTIAVITTDNTVRASSPLFSVARVVVPAQQAVSEPQMKVMQQVEGQASIEELASRPTRYDQQVRYMRQTRPNAPSRIQVTDSGGASDGSPYDYSILMWHDNSSNESEFVIERRSIGGWELIGRTSANETQFEDRTVDWSHATNWYRVRAHNLFGYSDYSNETYLSHLADPNLNPVGGTDVLVPEALEETCSASGGKWIGWGINHCSHAYQAVYGAVQTVTNPLVQVYKVYFAIVGSGSAMRHLPEDVIQLLKPYYGETLLRNVEYGSSDHTSSDQTAMCDCMDMYFPAGSGVVANIKNGEILARDDEGKLSHYYDVRWLLHELEHARQCADWGGRENYAVRWFGHLSATTIEELITNPRKVSNKKLHNSMPMEEQAKAKAFSVIAEIE